MEYRIVYKEQPYNYTMPRVLVVSAESKVDAFIVAIDKLSRLGHYVETYSINKYSQKCKWNTYLEEVFSVEELDELVDRGVKPTLGAKVCIRIFETHTLKMPCQAES